MAAKRANRPCNSSCTAGICRPSKISTQDRTTPGTDTTGQTTADADNRTQTRRADHSRNRQPPQGHTEAHTPARTASNRTDRLTRANRHRTASHARLSAALEGRHDVRLRDLHRPVSRHHRRLPAVALPLALVHDVVELLARQPDVRGLAPAPLQGLTPNTVFSPTHPQLAL